MSGERGQTPEPTSRPAAAPCARHAASGATAPALTFAHADVGYGRESVVSDATFEVAAGEVVGLVGPNGAGKSTLLRAITGDSDLLGGGVSLRGTDVRVLPPLQRARLVAVVPQQVSAAFSLPARTFVEMGRHPHLSRFARLSQGDHDVVERAMRVTDTFRLAERPADALSGGDLQRLALAQALAQEPSVLLLDEPVSHLDLNHRMQVLDLTRDLADSGLAVLAVFHDLDLAARYADRVAVVAEGSVSSPGRPHEVITAEMLRAVFGVRAVIGTDVVTGSVSVTPVLREHAVVGVARGRVLVIGGSGVAAPLMRRLILAGWDVSAGALNIGDADQLVAEALGIDYVVLPPFAPMDAAAESRVGELAEAADAVVVTGVPFGNGNVGNLLAASRQASKVVLVGGIEGRDFAGGDAECAWRAAIASGATTVASLAAVDSALEALRPDAARA